jgi:plastocyanin
MRITTIRCLGAVLCAAAFAAPASAQVQPAGTGEPAYTRSAQNTQWFEWSATAGADAYRVRFDYYENNTLKASPVVNQPSANAGSAWANWSGVATLQHGAQYGICAQGQYSFPNDSLFFPDGPNSCSMGTMLGRRAYTTIDRSKPTAALQLAGGAGFVNDAKVPVRVDFSDDVAGPFPANFLCFQVGGGPTGVCDSASGKIYGHNPACSVPGSAGKSTTFSCTADYGAAPDGNVWACVIAADASIPDNPSGPDQTSTAEKANLSDPSCDGVVLDRTPPVVSIGGASASVKVGDLVSFQASASDATSGLSGAGQWAWGDNTGGGSGDTVTHTYTAPGTYEVALKVVDAAGNAATAKKAITVTAAGDTAAPSGDGGTTSPPPAGGGTTGPPPAGGGTAQPDGQGRAPSLAMRAPRSAPAGVRTLRVKLTASGPGRVQLSLVRGARVIARAGVRLRNDGTANHRLALPKATKAGRYTLKATYTPTGGRTINAQRSITLTGRPSARRATASSSAGVVLGPGPRALPDGRFHGARPSGTFRVR